MANLTALRFCIAAQYADSIHKWERLPKRCDRANELGSFLNAERSNAVTATPKVEAYCAKCKSRQSMQDASLNTMQNGRPSYQGTCSVCGAKLHRIAADKP